MLRTEDSRTSWRARLAALFVVSAVSACGITLDEQQFLFPSPTPLPIPAEKIVRDNVEVVVPGPESGASVALRGWHLRRPDSTGLLVYFYGNGQNVPGVALELYTLADQLALDVLCIDYRGYGFSSGQPTMADLRRDALVIADRAAELAGGRPLYLLGYSLGSGPAIHVAAHRNLAGLILVAPLASAQEMVDHLESQLPWYARLLFDLELGPSLAAIDPSPVEQMPGVTEPLLVVHGDRDVTVPIEQGRRVFGRAASSRKSFCQLPGAGHQVSFARHPVFADCVTRFLSR